MKIQLETGFAKVSLEKAFLRTTPIADEICVRALAVRHGQANGILLSLDIEGDRGHMVTLVRQHVADATEIHIDRIACCCTHNHGAVTLNMSIDEIAKISAIAATQAIAAMQPTEIARFTVRPDPPLCICRRVKAPQIGTFTFWFGHRDRGNGKADGSYLLKSEIDNLASGNVQFLRCKGSSPKDDNAASSEDASPLYFPSANDQELQGLFFRSIDGRPLGTILRFPAHAVTANVGNVSWRSGDYPVYATAEVEKHFGGIALFLQGTAGDQAPIIEAKSLELAQTLGTKLGQYALSALSNIAWETDSTFEMISPSFTLRARETFLMNVDQVNVEQEAIIDQLTAMSKSAKPPLALMKALCERHEAIGQIHAGTPRIWGQTSPESAVSEGINFKGCAIRFGTTILAGWPGELFGIYTERLRRVTGLGERLITAGMVNGDIGYFPTMEEYLKGSYEVGECFFQSDSEIRLLNGMWQAIERLKPVKSRC